MFPPRPSMRLVRDTITFTAAEMPRWHSISISGYHIREAGSTAAEELAFTLANGFAYVELALQAGLPVDCVRAAAVVLLQRPHRLLRRDRQVPRGAPDLGALDDASATGPSSERSMQLRFHTQTAGVSLTAQQPEVNIVRTAIEALAGVLGGTQSLHTNSMDEAMALPTEKAARIALRTQQVIAHETNVAHVADPLGGSWYVEAAHRRDRAPGRGAVRPPRRARRRLDARRCDHRASRTTGSRASIADSAYELERRFNTGRRIDRRGQRLHRRQRRGADAVAADHQRGRSPPAQAPRRGPPPPRPGRGRRRPRPRCGPKPPTRRST